MNKIKLMWWISNIIVVGMFWVFIYALVNNWWLSLLISGGLFAVQHFSHKYLEKVRLNE